MIVIARSYGQLGNRLILYAHFIAAAEEYGVRLANPCFSDYAHLFPATENDLWCRYPVAPTSGRKPKLWQRRWVAQGTYLATRAMALLGLGRRPIRVIRIKGERVYDIGDKDFATLVRQRHIAAQGWLFRSGPLMRKHADKVRAHFRIPDDHQRAVDELVEGMRENTDAVIGVHIRHGDYATFMNGKYFYSVAQYAAVMREMADQLAPRRVAFLVCGNGDLDPSEFDGLNVTFGTGHLLEDLYALAATDFLIGPPSTFTGWASFYGDIPLRFIEAADEPIDVSPLADKLDGCSDVCRVA